MKIIRSSVCIILLYWLVSASATAQVTARRLTKKITDANAAANQVNQPAPTAVAPPQVIAPPARIVTNGVPEKTTEEKAAILQRTIEFQKKRAEAGAPSAQYDLGLRYLNGDGVERNPELAQKWLHSAATNGNMQAVKKLKELDKK